MRFVEKYDTPIVKKDKYRMSITLNNVKDILDTCIENKIKVKTLSIAYNSDHVW